VKFENKKNDFFNEHENREVKVVTKFLEDGSYFIYQGTLIRKSGDFIHLLGCKARKVKNDKVVEEKDIRKLAISKNIVGYVEFI